MMISCNGGYNSVVAEAMELESLRPKQSIKVHLLQGNNGISNYEEYDTADFMKHHRHRKQSVRGERKTTSRRIRARRKLLSSPSSRSSSSLFDSDESSSAFDSNRDELINMTEALAMNLSGSSSSFNSFSNSPTSSPNSAPTVSHSGPHFTDYDSFYYNDDPPPRGYDGHDNSQPYYSDPPPPTNNQEEPTTREFYEFIAFICWYAFLVLCCLFPTLFAWHRRRRNARLIRESLAMVRGATGANSLGRNIIRTGENGEDTWNLEVLAGGSGSGIDLENFGGRGGSDMRLLEWMNNHENDATGQRAHDWEFLEQLFNGSSSERNYGNNNSNVEGSLFGTMFPTGGVGGVTAHRRRIMMSDILSGMSVRIMMEREERRRRERGRKLVAALKQTSMVKLIGGCVDFFLQF